MIHNIYVETITRQERTIHHYYGACFHSVQLSDWDPNCNRSELKMMNTWKEYNKSLMINKLIIFCFGLLDI